MTHLNRIIGLRCTFSTDDYDRRSLMSTFDCFLDVRPVFCTATTVHDRYT